MEKVSQIRRNHHRAGFKHFSTKSSFSSFPTMGDVSHSYTFDDDMSYDEHPMSRKPKADMFFMIGHVWAYILDLCQFCDKTSLPCISSRSKDSKAI